VSVTDVQPSSIFRETEFKRDESSFRPENWESHTGPAGFCKPLRRDPACPVGAVAYGVVIQLVQTPDKKMSARQITEAIVRGP